MPEPRPPYTLWHIWDHYHAIRRPDGTLWRGPDGELQWHKPIAKHYISALLRGETPGPYRYG